MQLRAGPILLTYEGGFLRTLTMGGEEVLRMIYFALRDPDWNTTRVEITNESIQSGDDSFRLEYDWRVNDQGIQMQGRVQGAGQPDGSIQLDFYAKAINTFRHNRIGFCVLHPIEGLAGQPCRIEHPDGQPTEASFPDQISPYQPFLNVRGMTWQMASGRRLQIRFEGDVFETEDQRNWTDASYKTYCPPLERPFPVEVSAGTEIRQRVTFGVLPESSASTSDTTRLHRQPQPVTTPTKVIGSVHRVSKPRIGLGYGLGGTRISEQEAVSLQTLSLSHLRADVFLTDPNWLTELLAAYQDAHLLNIPLELALFFGSNVTQEAQQLIEHIKTENIPIYSLLLFEVVTRRTTNALLTTVASMFRQQLPTVQLGGGTDANFVDLNRNRFDVEPVDFVTYSINPQVHAFDDQTLMENVAAQADTVRSARIVSAGKPVHISPVTLRPRFNPDAKFSADRGVPPADPRQVTAFGAEWTRRSLAMLTQAGVASVTYYETHGPRGLVNGAETYPVFEVFRNG